MDRRRFITTAIPAALGGGPFFGQAARAAGSQRTPGKDGWIQLFDGRSLDGWYTFIRGSGRNIDPERSIRVENGLLHILASNPADKVAEPGYLATPDAFGDYRLRVEYKWGKRRYLPRQEWKRDNGILYHIAVPDTVWPACIECQIQESDVGDAIAGGGIRFVPGLSPTGGPPGLPVWPEPLGAPPNPFRITPPPATSVLRADGDFELRDDWNVVEVICWGDRAAHIVNGRMVATIFSIERPDPDRPGTFVRLDSGKIALEVEYAETFFRKVELQRL